MMAECREIQNRLTKKRTQKQESKRKAFVRLVLVGKVKQALGLLTVTVMSLEFNPNSKNKADTEIKAS